MCSSTQTHLASGLCLPHVLRRPVLREALRVLLVVAGLFAIRGGEFGRCEDLRTLLVHISLVERELGRCIRVHLLAMNTRTRLYAHLNVTGLRRLRCKLLLEHGLASNVGRLSEGGHVVPQLHASLHTSLRLG